MTKTYESLKSIYPVYIEIAKRYNCTDVEVGAIRTEYAELIRKSKRIREELETLEYFYYMVKNKQIKESQYFNVIEEFINIPMLSI